MIVIAAYSYKILWRYGRTAGEPVHGGEGRDGGNRQEGTRLKDLKIDCRNSKDYTLERDAREEISVGGRNAEEMYEFYCITERINEKGLVERNELDETIS